MAKIKLVPPRRPTPPQHELAGMLPVPDPLPAGDELKYAFRIVHMAPDGAFRTSLWVPYPTRARGFVLVAGALAELNMLKLRGTDHSESLRKLARHGGYAWAYFRARYTYGESRFHFARARFFSRHDFEGERAVFDVLWGPGYRIDVFNPTGTQVEGPEISLSLPVHAPEEPFFLAPAVPTASARSEEGLVAAAPPELAFRVVERSVDGSVLRSSRWVEYADMWHGKVLAMVAMSGLTIAVIHRRGRADAIEFVEREFPSLSNWIVHAYQLTNQGELARFGPVDYRDFGSEYGLFRALCGFQMDLEFGSPRGQIQNPTIQVDVSSRLLLADAIVAPQEPDDRQRLKRRVQNKYVERFDFERLPPMQARVLRGASIPPLVFEVRKDQLYRARMLKYVPTPARPRRK